MPIPGARYRFKRTSKGAVRLAFKGNKVVETKPYKRTRSGLKPTGPAKQMSKGAQ